MDMPIDYHMWGEMLKRCHRYTPYSWQFWQTLPSWSFVRECWRCKGLKILRRTQQTASLDDVQFQTYKRKAFCLHQIWEGAALTSFKIWESWTSDIEKTLRLGGLACSPRSNRDKYCVLDAQTQNGDEPVGEYSFLGQSCLSSADSWWNG